MQQRKLPMLDSYVEKFNFTGDLVLQLVLKIPLDERPSSAVFQ